MLALAGCRCFEPSCINYHHNMAAQAFDATAQAQQSQESAGQAAEEAPLPSPESGEAEQPYPHLKRERLKIPPELPGADAPPLRIPPPQPDQPEELRRKTIRDLYSPLPAIPDAMQRIREGAAQPLTLERLQSLAFKNSPVLRQAAADVESARGAVIQAGAYPNPEIGYESDTVGTANTAGYHGGYLQQSIVTAGKLRLAQAAAAVDLENARIALRKARVKVATNVRAAYFAALVARERMKLANALARFTNRIYQTQIDLVEGGESAPYEPMQLRVFALQARAAVVKASREYQSQWRQLAAAIGLPELPPTELAGRVDIVVPDVTYERALNLMLTKHTDLLTAANSVGQAGVLLRSAQVAPIPNIDTYLAVQRDYTFQPGTTTINLQVGTELPVFNRNRGNIISAQAQLFRAEQTVNQVRNDLTAALADAFARYETSRLLAETFRAEALRDQVRAYRGVYQRYLSDPQGIQFNDVVVAQQTLALTLGQYIDVLGSQWQAVVDIAELLQVDDVFLLGKPTHLVPIPELDDVVPEELPNPELPQGN